MFAGHFGVAIAVKGKAKNVPLWGLLISSQLLDIVFFPLALIGIEYFGTPIAGGKGMAIHAEYSHSLVSAILLSVMVGVIGNKIWGKRSGITLGYLTFSHWIIDLIVHVPDLPILPGNLGNFPYLGFGLWQYPLASVLLEGGLILLGAIFYFNYIIKSSEFSWNNKAMMMGSFILIMLVLSFVLGV